MIANPILNPAPTQNSNTMKVLSITNSGEIAKNRA